MHAAVQAPICFHSNGQSSLRGSGRRSARSFALKQHCAGPLCRLQYALELFTLQTAEAIDRHRIEIIAINWINLANGAQVSQSSRRQNTCSCSCTENRFQRCLSLTLNRIRLVPLVFESQGLDFLSCILYLWDFPLTVKLCCLSNSTTKFEGWACCDISGCNLKPDRHVPTHAETAAHSEIIKQHPADDG